MCSCWNLGAAIDTSVHLRILLSSSWSLIAIMGSVVGMLLLLLIVRGSLTGGGDSRDASELDMEEDKTLISRRSSESDRKSRIERRDGMLSMILLIMAAVISWNTARWYSITVIVYLVLALLVACYKVGLQQGGKDNGKDAE